MGVRSSLFSLLSGDAVDSRIESVVNAALLKHQDRNAAEALDLARQAVNSAKQATQLAKSALATAESGADGVTDLEDTLGTLTSRIEALERAAQETKPARKKPAAKKSSATKKSSAAKK